MKFTIKKLMMVVLKSVVLECDLNRETIACVATWHEGLFITSNRRCLFILLG